MNNEFQYRLLKSIAEKGISAAELSRISGVNKVAISNYINGVYVPKQDKCYLLAKALGVDPGWLMTGEEPTVLGKEQIPVVIPDSEKFRQIMENMSVSDYEMVMDAFARTERKMREEGKI